jgi:ferredoxin
LIDVSSTTVKILANRDLCVGAAMCSLTAPDLFDQDPDEGLVMVLDEHPDRASLADAREAVGLCPSGALRLIGDDESEGDAATV